MQQEQATAAQIGMPYLRKSGGSLWRLARSQSTTRMLQAHLAFFEKKSRRSEPSKNTVVQYLAYNQGLAPR